jgi:hypothetical protein
MAKKRDLQAPDEEAAAAFLASPRLDPSEAENIGTNEEWALANLPWVRIAYLITGGSDEQVAGIMDELGEDKTLADAQSMLETARHLQRLSDVCVTAVCRMEKVSEARGL